MCAALYMAHKNHGVRGCINRQMWSLRLDDFNLLLLLKCLCCRSFQIVAIFNFHRHFSNSQFQRYAKMIRLMAQQLPDLHFHVFIEECKAERAGKSTDIHRDEWTYCGCHSTTKMNQTNLCWSNRNICTSINSSKFKGGELSLNILSNHTNAARMGVSVKLTVHIAALGECRRILDPN